MGVHWYFAALAVAMLCLAGGARSEQRALLQDSVTLDPSTSIVTNSEGTGNETDLQGINGDQLTTTVTEAVVRNFIPSILGGRLDFLGLLNGNSRRDFVFETPSSVVSDVGEAEVEPLVGDDEPVVFGSGQLLSRVIRNSLITDGGPVGAGVVNAVDGAAANREASLAALPLQGRLVDAASTTLTARLNPVGLFLGRLLAPLIRAGGFSG